MIVSSTDSPLVGFIGLGVMGRGMAASLQRTGRSIIVHNRSRDAELPFVEQGARRAATPLQVAKASKVIFLCLSDTAAVEAVLFGPDGLAQGLAAGSQVIDTSTIAAGAVREFGKRLAAQGMDYIDAPVSGGQQGAEAGTLTCMVGASKAAFDRCEPYIKGIASRIHHVGESGAGQIAKYCNQVAVTSVMLGVAESFALARSHGLDPAVVREVLLGGTARSTILEKNAPRLIERNFKPGFRAELMRKDMRLALEAGRDRSAFMAGASLTLQLLEAACNAGHAQADWSSLGRLIEELSGQSVSSAGETG